MLVIMEDVIENYLRHGDYPIGDQTCEKVRRRHLVYIKTDTSLKLYDSSFNGRLSHELQVQIVNIYVLVIKDKKIMVTALPVQQQTADTLTCGVIAIALTYHFSRGNSSFIFIHLYCTCLQPEWRK